MFHICINMKPRNASNSSVVVVVVVVTERPLGHLTNLTNFCTNFYHFFNFGKFVKIRNFFCWGNEFSIYDCDYCYISLAQRILSYKIENVTRTPDKWLNILMYSIRASLFCVIVCRSYKYLKKMVPVFGPPKSSRYRIQIDGYLSLANHTIADVSNSCLPASFFAVFCRCRRFASRRRQDFACV